ncbi:hypothetical protein WK74_14715 [Burkholderia ubonensis]|nr:hypothetical protein WK74_14715 [Burkholderia ubonensis]
MLPIMDPLAVDKYGEMRAQRALVVEDVATQSRLFGEDGFERCAERARVDLALGGCDVSLDRGCEEDVRHDERADGVAVRGWPGSLVL